MQIYIMITVREKSEDYDDKSLKCLKRCILSREHGDIELFGLSFLFWPTCPLNQCPGFRQGLDGRLQAAMIPPGRHAHDTFGQNFHPESSGASETARNMCWLHPELASVQEDSTC